MCFNEIPLHNFVFEILLFNFQRPMRMTSFLACDFSIILYHFPFVKPFLKTFLSFFSLFYRTYIAYTLKGRFPFFFGCSISIPFDFRLVKGFFRFFPINAVFRHTVCYTQKNRRLYKQNAQKPYQLEVIC